jgi:hypothetical protein
MTGFVTAGDIYHVNLAAGATDAVPTVLRRTVLEGLNADEFITSQVFIASKDGTKVCPPAHMSRICCDCTNRVHVHAKLALTS